MFGFTNVTNTWTPQLQVKTGDVILSIKAKLNYPEAIAVDPYNAPDSMSAAKPEISPGKMQVKERERGK